MSVCSTSGQDNGVDPNKCYADQDWKSFEDWDIFKGSDMFKILPRRM